MKIGDSLTGRISGIQPYGAFVELADGSKGLIHISEIKAGYVDQIDSLLSLGQEVTVQVLDIDEFNQKASLSLRSLSDEKHLIRRHHRFTREKGKTGFAPLGKKMPGWIKEGLENLNK